MTLMGKILTVLILFMSVLFMGFAICVYATHRNWKELATQLQKDIRAQKDVNQQLRVAKDQLQRQIAQERVARAVALAVLEARNVTDRDAAKTLRADLDSKNQMLQTTSNQLTTVLANIKKIDEDNRALRTTIVQVRQNRNEQFQTALKATDEVNRLTGQLVAFRKRNGQLAFLVAQGKAALDKLGINPASVTNVPPTLDGKVKVVSKRNYVEISLGSDDGLKIGHQLDVIRDNGTYVGRIVVRKIEPDRAVGEVLKDYRQTPVKANDRVVTRKT